MTSDDQPGTPTSPFGSYPSAGYSGPQYVAGDYQNTQPEYQNTQPDYQHTQPLGGYSAADFPAPAGVPPLVPRPVDTRYGAGAGGSAVGLATRPRRRAGSLIAAASLAALIGAGAGVGSYAYLTDDSTAGRSTISVTTASASQAPTLNGTISAAAAKIQPSVVTITVQSGSSGDIGSGVVLDTDGHILTNDHVVADAVAASSDQTQGGQDGQTGSGQSSSASTITVTFHDGTTAKATVVGTSETNDLAVIKVDGVKNLTPAVFAKSSAVTVGEAVVAAGAPLGLSESITSGIVSNAARPVRSGNNDDAVYLAVQTDAAINPGNSGGPLVDLNGSVLGINSSIASTGSSSSTTTQSGNIGIGFAIPADVAVRVSGELISSGKSVNAALGVTVGGSDSDLSTATGVALQSVTSGGAAAKAGLQQGDVVTRVDDFSTTTSDGLIAATRFYAPGTEITVTYTRGGGAAKTAKVTLGQQ
ncbi:S1C family serine protease [uncultured Friedmanniella sp.]|uniref:S1C family serine protease n=1 Tax=uncultured Friedmanniella sp. TaxID=335381 RepID=UPI0035C980D6